MHILLVIDGMHPRSGGPPAVIAGSALALVARGHAVTVLCSAKTGDEAVVRTTWAAMLDAGVAIQFCAPEGLAGILGFGGQQALITAAVAAADVVHLHGVWNPLLLVTGRIARRLGTPYFLSAHGVFDRRAMERIRSKFVKKRLAVRLLNLVPLLEQSAGLIFGSAAEAAESWLPSSDIPLAFVPNGAAATAGTGTPTSDDMARLHAAAPAVAGWQRTILCRSRIHEEKGLDMIVAAFNRIAADFPGTGLLIAGMAQDAAYQTRIQAMIADGPVADRIALTTALTGPTTQFLYQACDIFAMPSIAEGFSMAMIEALANGRPLLLTRYCHNPAVAEAGAGLIVEPSVDAIADGLRAMLARDDTELAAMGQSARRLFVDRFTWDRVAEALEHIYAAAVAKVAA